MSISYVYDRIFRPDPIDNQPHTTRAVCRACGSTFAMTEGSEWATCSDCAAYVQCVGCRQHGYIVEGTCAHCGSKQP